MAEFHHPENTYFPNQGNNGRMEEPAVEPDENPVGRPAIGQEVGPVVEPEEYVVTDYEYGESDQELDEARDVEETYSEPHLSEVPSDPHTIQKSDTYHIHSLEEEITNLKLQLFAAEARVVRAEQREEIITQEVNEVAELLIRQLDN